jgi:hypothetical protein
MSTISSGTTLTTALVQIGDTTGDLVIKTGASNTTAMTISGANQSVTLVGSLTANTNASTITTGTVPTARLATGTANSSTYLRGDQTWATVTQTRISGGTTGLTPSSLTSGDVTLAGTLTVANGGTGATTLTANNVLLGNGTSALQVVAPSTSGNVLTSNGTTWASSAPAASGLGIGQTWTNVSGSRSSGTTYTNSTSKPIQIMVATDNTGNTQYGSGGSSKFFINGNNVGEAFCSNAANVGGLFQAIIPVSSTYQVTTNSLRTWWELR